MTAQALLLRFSLFVLVTILSLGLSAAESTDLKEDLFSKKAVTVPATEATLQELKKTVDSTTVTAAPPSLALPKEEVVKVDPLVEVEKEVPTVAEKAPQPPVLKEGTEDVEQKIAALAARIEVLEKSKSAAPVVEEASPQPAHRSSVAAAFGQAQAFLRSWVVEPLHAMLSRYLGK